jgi:hypothetical protein
MLQQLGAPRGPAVSTFWLSGTGTPAFVVSFFRCSCLSSFPFVNQMHVVKTVRRIVRPVPQAPRARRPAAAVDIAHSQQLWNFSGVCSKTEIDCSNCSD